MSNPRRFINRMILFLLIAGAVVGALYEVIFEAFAHNPALNGLIIGVLVVGIGFTFSRVLVLRPASAWLEDAQYNASNLPYGPPPRLLAPVATVIGESKSRGRSTLSAGSVRYLLDSIAARLDESRDISRYLTGLLIFLGLLGTFWGLLQTIGSVSDVIANLEVGESEDLVSTFDRLKAGLAAPMDGMGTAFSSSLFGLAGSLILGFMDLQANQAQNAFYNHLEEWLTGLTRLASQNDNDDNVPIYVQALLEQTADSIDALQRSVTRAEDARTLAARQQGTLVEHLSVLGDHMSAQANLLNRIAAQQEDLRPALHRLSQGSTTDEALLSHMRRIEGLMAQLLDVQRAAGETGTRGGTAEGKGSARGMAHNAPAKKAD